MRSTFKVLFYVNGSKEKNGIVPIMGRVTINGSVSQFSCKQSIHKDLWDVKGNRAKGKSKYRRKKYAGRVMFVETNPCTEFCFLLHFLPNVVCRRYDSYEQMLPELQKYMPGYEKTKRYFIRTNLYKYLIENGDLERAMLNSEKLCQLCKESPEDIIAYSEIHKVISMLNKL